VTTVDDAVATARSGNPFVRLYRGETAFDFVGRRRWWYTISLVVILAGLVSLGTRGLNLGIEFRGGTSWEVTMSHPDTATVQRAVAGAGVTGATVQILGGRTVQVQADLNKESATKQEQTKQAVSAALGKLAGVPASGVSTTDVGPTWGSQITQKAIIAVIVFFVVVVLYISFRFEWKMAVAALAAVIHDLLVVAGVYSLSGLQVTPDTVIAVLTILGYSLYDTVVVFDRVTDNTKGLGASGRMTYDDVVNLSMNQTLARSINTSLVAVLPVLSVLVIGAQLLGATTLEYFGFALTIGLVSGAYSSIFIASPLLAQMKEREPRYQTIRQKLESRAEREGLLTPRAAAALMAASSGTAGRARAQARAGVRRQGQVIRPGSGRTGGLGAGAGTRLAVGDGAGELPGGDVAATAVPGGAGAEGMPGGSAGAVARSGGARPAPARSGAQGGPRRPPPRARRKGGGKKGGRRR